ncbi:unnamed protein product [Arctia plantaginis]|uniref:Uncharacterized protein n=1 Tax=Arctia plantaginis TaxID=874455 RepID=A0A8S1AGP2_ARCPL|nr:unnamed protein product [Arctia plantaginis]
MVSNTNLFDTHRSEAVLINPGKGKSSGEILGALRLGLQPEDLGLVIRAVWTPRKGGLLIEFDGSVKDRSKLCKRITEAAGSEVGVRHLVSTTAVVIEGLDAARTVEEIKEAVRKDISEGVEGLKVSITQANMGTRDRCDFRGLGKD